MVEKRSSVKEIYEFCSENELPMLSSYNADFWNEYVANYAYFDRIFMKSYKSFLAFGNDNDTVDENVADWILDVTGWLTMNHKRYSELWRLQALSDSDYNILSPYNVSEVHNVTSESSSTDNMGSKTDTKAGTYTHGGHTVSEDNTMVKGAVSESDAESLSYDTDRKTTDITLDIGSQNNTTENTVSADNVSTYSPKDFINNNLGSREDTTNTVEVRDSRDDSRSLTHTEASRTDRETKEYEKSSQADTSSDTNIYGAHTNTHTGEEESEKTVTREGNIGVMSGSRLLSEHVELWQAYNFYKIIFDDIANEFLRIVYH